MIYFISDTHFGHKNIIKYDKLPFSNVEDMDQTIIDDWNSVVSTSDIVYMLGDFTLRGIDAATAYMYRLNGQIRILGNIWHHDKRWLEDWSDDISHVKILPPVRVLDFPEYSFDGEHPRGLVLSHYPYKVWDRKHHWAWHLHGHVHDEYPQDDLSMNVAASVLFKKYGTFEPVSIDLVKASMNAREAAMLARGITMP